MIQLENTTGQKILEIGGGANRNPASTVNVDIRKVDGVDFAVDFETSPWPISSSEFDAVLAFYVLEHVSFPKLSGALNEIHRVLKDGGRLVATTPNTEAQLEWIKSNQQGWDGEDYFTSASKKLFGGQDYSDNSHKSFFSPTILTDLLTKAGFENVITRPYGTRNTDLFVQAIKPAPKVEKVQESKPEDQFGQHLDKATEQVAAMPEWKQNVLGSNVQKEDYQNSLKQSLDQISKEIKETGDVVIEEGFDNEIANVPGVTIASGAPIVVSESKGVWGELASKLSPKAVQSTEERERLFDRCYFDGGTKVGGYASPGYRDFPNHEIIARHVLARRPESVLELGCGRGYVLKRLQDAGVNACGSDISTHCYMTRVSDNLRLFDLCLSPWAGGPSGSRIGDQSFDLCFSMSFLEHIPEEFISGVMQEMQRTCKRGLHGVGFTKGDGFDKTRVTIKPREWWQAIVPSGHEVVDKRDLEQGPLPADVVKGDGKLKVAVGGYTTMYHHGWVNLDIHPLQDFAAPNGYNFRQHDYRTGLPFHTSSVDLIYLPLFLQRLDYQQGLSFLRECRRVIKPDGVMRLSVVDAALLTNEYLGSNLDQYAHINEAAETRPSSVAQLWSLLFAGHMSAYDIDMLEDVLDQSGFTWQIAGFRQAVDNRTEQILREALETIPCLSLFCDARPQLEK